jgi:hypothetical protein
MVNIKLSLGKRPFLDHIELWLSLAGLVVALGVPHLLGVKDGSYWQVMAVVAMTVGLIHGAIFWFVRRRQRQIRRSSIHDIREMLADVVKNQLTAIDMYLPPEDQTIVRQELDGIRASIERITEEVDTLSEESIHDWKTKYDGAIRRTTTLTPATEDDFIPSAPNPTDLSGDGSTFAHSPALPSKNDHAYT